MQRYSKSWRLAFQTLKLSCVNMMASQPGLFITLEGAEGVGKSTAAAGLAALLRADGGDVMLTREPGGTSGAEAIRQLLLEKTMPLVPLAQTLLHFAARADHVEQSIRPALAQGKIVICDRFYDSTLAYQAYGQGVVMDDIKAMIKLIRLTPDLTFLLELSEEKIKQRLAARGGETDRYEAMEEDFFGRVGKGFDEIATSEPKRFVRVDASLPQHDVATTLRRIIFERTGR